MSRPLFLFHSAGSLSLWGGEKAENIRYFISTPKNLKCTDKFTDTLRSIHKPLSRQEIWPQTKEPFIIFSLFFFNVSVIQFSLFPKISPNLYYLSHGEKPHIFVDVQGDKASQFYTCHALGEPPVGGHEKPGEASEKLAGVPDVSFCRRVRDVMLCHRF